jgi:chaperonin cofactor prefoldin
MTTGPAPQAISEIDDPEKIRVVLFINNQFVHVPLPALVSHLTARIDDLEARVTALETP